MMKLDGDREHCRSYCDENNDGDLAHSFNSPNFDLLRYVRYAKLSVTHLEVICVASDLYCRLTKVACGIVIPGYTI
jgi:hypothetical protein